MAYERKRPKNMIPPPVIQTPEQRGEALQVWLNVQDIPVGDFAEKAKIGRTTLFRYLKGEKDLAGVETQIADQLLRAMGIADTDAWDVLNIPAEARATFRSFRPWPMGHGADPTPSAGAVDVFQLTQPMFGSVALPSGAWVRIRTGENKLPHQIYRLADGRLFASQLGAQVTAEWLGGLSSAHFENPE